MCVKRLAHKLLKGELASMPSTKIGGSFVGGALAAARILLRVAIADGDRSSLGKGLRSRVWVCGTLVRSVAR